MTKENIWPVATSVAIGPIYLRAAQWLGSLLTSDGMYKQTHRALRKTLGTLAPYNSPMIDTINNNLC